MQSIKYAFCEKKEEEKKKHVATGKRTMLLDEYSVVLLDLAAWAVLLDAVAA